MLTPEELIQLFGRTNWIIKKQVEGLTHEESLIDPPFRGNCLNWVLGHIVAGRSTILRALGAEPVWDEATVARYDRGSEVLTPDEALPLEQLREDLNRSQERIVATLRDFSSEALAQPTPQAPTAQSIPQATTVGEWVAFLHWHETYHTGQLELLRQLAGKNDAIIR